MKMMLTKLKDWMLHKVEVNRFDLWLYRTVIYLGFIVMVLEYLFKPTA